MKEINLNVEGMHCGGCEKRIQNVISDLKEVKSVQANHESGNVNIVFKKEVDEKVLNTIKEKIEIMDFKVVEKDK